ncbi:MAG: hypothetical protein CSA66_00400 [Proteobacteria bacterium]|nr:MAG: hypothetical protein CSA66_00400 [Pseudomonadota bacterium]
MGDSSSVAKYAYGDWSKDLQVSSDVRRALDGWRQARVGSGAGKHKRHARRRQTTTDGPRDKPRCALAKAAAAPSTPEPTCSRHREETVEVVAFDLDPMLDAETAKAPARERTGRLLLELFILVTAVGTAYALWTLT